MSVVVVRQNAVNMGMPVVEILVGDCREVLKTRRDESVNCCVTSPPYFGLRDYGHAGQIGLEETPEAYVAQLVEVFREVRRVLRDDGTLWLNLGDSYAVNSGCRKEPNEKRATVQVRPPRIADVKPKDLIGIPWRVAFALQADGWYLRCDIIWSKPNPMPESVLDRPTKSHEYIFLLSKQARYYYDAEAIREPATKAGTSGHLKPGKCSCMNGHPTPKSDKQRGHSRRHAGFNERWDRMSKEERCSGMRNKRSVWEVATTPYAESHFATFPPDLIKPCILAGCPVGGTVLDPFGGSGTTGQVALELGRNAVLIELNPEYAKLAERRSLVTPGLGL